MAVKRVIADVNDEAAKLNPILSGVVQSTGQMKQDLNDALTSVKAIKDAAKDIKMPKAGADATAIAGDSAAAKDSMNTFDPTPNASTIVASTKDGARQTGYSGGPGGGDGDGGGYSGPNWDGYGGWKTGPQQSSGAFGKAVKTAIIGSAAAIGQAIDVGNYTTNDVSRRRFGFFAGEPGTDKGASTFQNMMNSGFGTSSLDAADAAMSGVSSGLMPGLKNYKGIAGSAAGISNLLPGAGLTASMGAVGALNQASSVNKLRMIGIQVRDQNGYMRGVESIAKDLWNTLNKSKAGGGSITAQDLSYSLQSGMSLDSLLNQYFSGDPVLRDAVIAYLYQFASGKTTSKKDLQATGAMPGISQSIAKRMAAAYGAENAVTSAGVAGIEFANQGITDLATNIKNLRGELATARDSTVSTAAALEVFTGAANGAVGTLLGTALSATITSLGGVSTLKLGGLVGKLGKIKGLGGIIAGLTAILEDGSLGDDSANANTGNGGNISNGGISDTRGWASGFLKQLGYKDTPENLNVIQGWITHENSQYSNNPLAITHTNSNGLSQLSAFSSQSEGLTATANLLKANKNPGDQYYNINKALTAGNDEGATWAAIATSPWDATRYGTAKTGQAYYYGPGGTITINITGADLADSKQLAQDIKDTIDNAIAQQRN